MADRKNLSAGTVEGGGDSAGPGGMGGARAQGGGTGRPLGGVSPMQKDEG